MSSSGGGAGNESGGWFATTHWTAVLAAQGESHLAREALSALCATYYGPVVAFLRREGRDEDAARELAHEFFARVLEGQSLAPDPARGRFRSYLLGALKHFLANRRTFDHRARRGSGAPHLALPIESDTSSALLHMAADQGKTPEASFDRDWALSVLDRAMIRLKREWEENGAADEFELISPWLNGAPKDGTQAGLARQLSVTEGAARVTLHRFRRRFGEMVRAEIAQTVNSPAEIAEELRHLIEAVA